MKNIALYLAVAVLAAACASKDTKTEAQVDDKSTPVTPPKTATGSDRATGVQPQPKIAGDPLKDPNSPLYKHSVFFDFDSNAVKDEYRGTITAHSRYLTGDRKDTRIRIEGNCDERGSREYNLALGQRRADAVKQMLQLLGARADQIESVSFGEEKPRCTEQTETCWAQNRRGDIAYQGE